MSTTHAGLPPLSGRRDATVTCPDCGLQAQTFAATCHRCGAPLPPPGGAVWREGRALVALRDSALPDRCVRCGAPGDGRRIRRRLYWHHPALYLLVLFWVIPYIVVALALRRTTTLTLSVCERHRRIRRWSLWSAWGLFAAAIATGVVAVALTSVLLGWLFLALIIAAPGVGIGGRRLLAATQIDERLVRTLGAGAGFMRALRDRSAPEPPPSAGRTAGPPSRHHPSPVHDAVSAAEIGDILARAWPELPADTARVAEYAWALEGLHPGVIENVVASFARERRPLPTPALLRMAVLARTRSNASYPSPAPTTAAANGWEAPAGGHLPWRGRAAVLLALSGVAAVMTLVSARMAWARVISVETLDVPAGEIVGGPIVLFAALLALLVSIVGGVVLGCRGRPTSVRLALGLAASVHAIALAGALLGLSDVRLATQEIAEDVRLSGLQTGVAARATEVAVAPGLWVAIVISALGLATALYGLVAMRRCDQER